MAVGKAGLSFLDKQGKTGTVGFYTNEFTAGTFTALNGLIDDAVAAIAAVTLLNLAKDERLASIEKFSVGLPTDSNAVKGVRWLVRGVDSNGNAVTMQIPGADLSLSTNAKDLDLTAGEGLALKTALDAVWRSNDGESVTTVEVVYLDK
jgi:hypothetical protein